MKLFALTLLLLLFSNNLSAEPLSAKEKQRARSLLLALGCRACHDFDQSGSNLSISLDRIGLKLEEDAILKQLQKPAEKLGKGEKFMPSYRTTAPDQLKLLSHYLAQRK